MTLQLPEPFTAVILAADRTTPDPVAAAAGTPCKALAPVGGRPMVFRVLDALEASKQVDRCILCGPPAAIVEREPLIRQRMAAGSVCWLPPQATPSTSAFVALQSVAAGTPVLLTTADHALLTPEMIDHCCLEARAVGSDVVAALTSHERIMARYPGMRRTRTRFTDGAFCGCNLFAFLTPESRAAADLWRRVENERKRPIKMLGQLGWGVVMRYLLNQPVAWVDELVGYLLVACVMLAAAERFPLLSTSSPLRSVLPFRPVLRHYPPQGS